jgi:hypothetical protein
VIACAVAGAAFACGYSDPEGEPVGRPAGLPRRATDAGPGDAEAAAPPPVATTPDARPPSTTCAASDLALCLRFENGTKDEAPAAVSAAVVSDLTFGPGKEDLGAHFITTSALRFGPSPAFELPATAATVEAWIKRENSAAKAVVFDDDHRLSLTIDAASHVSCQSSGGAVVGASAVPIQEWVHVACVVDGATLRAYLAGSEDGSGPGGVGSSPDLGAAIGGNSPEGDPFVGMIDSLRVFRVARTAAQIAAAAIP